MKEVLEIVREYLIAHGFTGLCAEDCGCGVDDLMTCGGDCSDCTPAYLCTTPRAECGEDNEDKPDEYFCTENPAECEKLKEVTDDARRPDET